MLDMEVDFPDIFGMVTDLPPWKLCRLVSRVFGFELVHQDVAPNAPQPLNAIVDNNIYYFEKFIWQSNSNESLFQLIQNVIKVPSSNLAENNLNLGSLFDTVAPPDKELFFLPEWKNVAYIVYTEGYDYPFVFNQLKNIQGVRMVLKSPINKFKNYSKIL